MKNLRMHKTNTSPSAMTIPLISDWPHVSPPRTSFSEKTHQLRNQLIILEQTLRTTSFNKRVMGGLAVLRHHSLEDGSKGVAKGERRIIIHEVLDDILLQRLKNVGKGHGSEHGDLLGAERKDRHGVRRAYAAVDRVLVRNVGANPHAREANNCKCQSADSDAPDTSEELFVG